MKTFTNCAEKKAKQFLNLLQGYTKGIRMTAILVLLLMGVSNAWASNGSEGTSITVYTSGELFGSAWDTSKSYIKIHVRRGTDDWMNYATMTETGKTYNGKKIYSYTFKEKWDGAQIYFEHWKTGSGSRISEYGTDWANTSTLNGKLYLGYMDNGHRWATLCYDATIYFLKNGKASSWTTPKAHAWNEGYSSVTTTWPGTTMTNTQKTYDGNPIYSVTFSNPPYSKVIFNQGNSTNQSGEQTIPDHEGKIFDYDANKWIDYTYDVTVTFKANGGTGSDYTQTVKYNTSTTLTANKFTRTGYSFNGWKTAANSGTSYADKANVTLKANTTLYAQWTPAKYTITYKDQNNATFSGSHANGYPTQHTYGTETTLSTATKTGYTFEGWYKESACTNKITSLDATAYTANITLYAKWTANKYTVTLSNQGATTAGTASVQATYGSAMPSATMPTKTGYTFGGYYTSNNGGGTQYYNANGASTRTWNIAENSTLYAKWTANQYTITYKDQGNVAFSGTHASTPPTTHTYGTATTLKNATKTGYTFEGWHTDQACTNKVTSLGATAYTAAITLYAKWTINQYTLTYSAGEGGSVTAIVDEKEISSPATLDHNTSITLTATPEGENAFAQWVDGNGNQISTKNPYELTITKNTTLKAQFTSPSRVYLKPFDFWKSDGARIAAYYWGAAGNNWIELSPVDCEKQYYSVDIPAGYSNIIFARLKPSSATGYDKNNNGFNWENSWNQTADLTVQTNGKNLYDMHIKDSRIYLKPNGWWTSDGARFAAFFKVNADNNDGGKWMSMFQLDSDNNYYWCDIPTDKNYIKVIFCRMNGANGTNDWSNKWNDFEQDIPSNEHNCYTLNNESWSEGSWSCYQYNNKWTTYSTPTYNVTIKPTIHGTYSVVCNGRTYLAPNKEEIVIPNVPVGTTLTIQDVKPNNETEYTSDIIYKESANAEYQTLEGNPITVCGNTTIDENFVTKNAHVVYFRVPTSLATSWNANGTTNFVYSYNDIKIGENGYVTTMAADNSIQDAQYTYYCCTIPADCHTFRFERKNNAKESAKQKTVSFTHAMPFNGMNCFTITNSGDEYTGYWDVLLTNGDYRLLYVEQVVEKSNASGNEWKTVVTRKKAHPSDIIKKGTPSQIVSLHIYKERTYMANAGGSEYESSNNPEIILQQYNSSTNTWENKERHMVFGPLQTLPGMAMAPGRRNAVANAELVYDDGIENIKNDNHVDQGSGVWNFTVTQSNGGESATIDLTQTRRYNEETDGPYYIRTDVANGNWYNYTNPDNHMTRSDVSKQHSNYSHYFCKWVKSTGNVNVKFTIANKYGYAISDTLEADRTDLWGVELTEAQKMLKDQTLPENANVRFTWNEKSNLIHRAYIAGSADVQDRFLVLKGSGDNKLFNTEGNLLIEGLAQTSRYGLHANEEIFSDIENWVYQTDVQMTPGAELQVTADYNNQIQYFVGKEGVFNNTILQGSNSGKYLIRLLYDFKTNELISAYVPGASKDVDQISTNLMIIRQNYNEAKQLVFNNGDMSSRENRKAYGVIEFTEDYLKNESIPYLKRCLYWVSFPFDVNLSEAFGSLVYGKHWLIQEYDGARRAAEGLWKESESFWKLHWEPNITLEAGLGYVIEIDINQMIKDNIIDTKDAKQQIAALYFPSNTPITREIINQASYTVNIPAHKCEIVHTGEFGDRTIRDSHWNVIGVPSYVNTGATFSDRTFALNNVVKYYYQWDGEVDKYTAMEADEQAYDFQSMYAYMVQYAGDITWNSVLLDVEPAQIAAKKNSVTNEHAMRLELQQNNILLDKTFVRLQDDVATPAFDFNYDLCKITNKGANIYSIITEEASPVEVAANVLPIKETIIPIGIKLDAAGEYTFAMPEGTDGIVVELIDYQANTTTNLLFNDYTVNLPKGTFENRFALSVKPDKTATSVENISNEVIGDKAKKYIIDGVLYMQKNGILYDAQGHIVR